MSPQKLVFTSFRKALDSLEAALNQPEVNDIVRDATIQRFEYTYEIAWKMMKRHLKWMEVAEIHKLHGKELFRKAAEVELIDNPEQWFQFKDARNKTSHTYNEEDAQEVYELAKAFLPVAQQLLRDLENAHG
jgi:nucleotidyltransferase substrate binding protein (TIGR01987 family)